MTPRNVIVHGDCLDVLPTLDAESVHCVVTDPPYEAVAHPDIDIALHEVLVTAVDVFTERDEFDRIVVGLYDRSAGPYNAGTSDVYGVVLRLSREPFRVWGRAGDELAARERSS